MGIGVCGVVVCIGDEGLGDNVRVIRAVVVIRMDQGLWCRVVVSYKYINFLLGCKRLV